MEKSSPKKMGVSKNNGTPKSSILIGFSIINHPFGVPLFLETPKVRGEHKTNLSCHHPDLHQVWSPSKMGFHENMTPCQQGQPPNHQQNPPGVPGSLTWHESYRIRVKHDKWGEITPFILLMLISNFIPFFTGFDTSQVVVWDFWTINRRGEKKPSETHWCSAIYRGEITYSSIKQLLSELNLVDWFDRGILISLFTKITT